jgi:hypothetical protein
MSDIAICTIFKNESRYLYEWLSYHYYIGIRKFVLYNNGSTDDSIDVIRNWPHSDAIKIIDWPQVRGQIPAYLHMIQKNRDVAEWCAFIDCDEFITPITDLSIPEIFDRIPEPVAGIYAFWMMFGSSGHIARPEGLVTETYTRRAPDNFGSHNYGKSIVRLRRALQPTMHVFQCEGPMINDAGLEIDPQSLFYQKNRSYELLSINHYFTKSLEEWRERRAKGQVSKAPGDPGYIRPDKDFYVHDINEILDERAANIMGKVREEFYPDQGQTAPKAATVSALDVDHEWRND